MQDPLTRIGIVPLRANLYAFKSQEGVIVCAKCGKNFSAKEKQIPYHLADTRFPCVGRGQNTEH
jgi:uncharacterized protein YbaR (Trm112 family)